VGTWWFNVLAALVIVGAILAAYQYRVKGLQLQTARLEARVAQRTRELEIAKNAAEAAKTGAGQARNMAEQARNSADQANQAKTTFLATMSHELRTPLNAILGFSNLLRENLRIAEKERKILDIISRRSGEHLLTLINDVLDMAKIDAGRIVIENITVGVSDLAEGVLDLMRLRAEEKGIALSFERTSGFCQFVQADGEKLRQMLLNLVGNAVKYTDQGV
jgi:signal transduction histidine kinase